MAEDHRFVADQMLGRLSKWLRMLGFDTLYINPVLDSDLLSLCKKDDRILLTRDTLLLKVREIRDGQVKSLLVDHDDLSEQLKQVIQNFHLRPNPRMVLCPEDNTLLEIADKQTARQFVPRFIFQTQMEFSRCPKCNRFYWQGTHWQRIQEKVRTASKTED